MEEPLRNSLSVLCLVRFWMVVVGLVSKCDALGISTAGSATRNTVSRPGTLSTTSRPPCASTIRRAIDRPSPAPLLFVPSGDSATDSPGAYRHAGFAEVMSKLVVYTREGGFFKKTRSFTATACRMDACGSTTLRASLGCRAARQWTAW
jgi:hypothetical protein